jgi:hypothetical protein
VNFPLVSPPELIILRANSPGTRDPEGIHIHQLARNIIVHIDVVLLMRTFTGQPPTIIRIAGYTGVRATPHPSSGRNRQFPHSNHPHRNLRSAMYRRTSRIRDDSSKAFASDANPVGRRPRRIALLRRQGIACRSHGLL